MLYCVSTQQVQLQQVPICIPEVGITYVSINKGHIAPQPLPSRTTHYDNAYRHGSPIIEVPRLSIGSITHQPATPPSALDEDTLYSCNIIAQLQGSYVMETSSGHVQVSVILPNVSGQVEQYAIAHRVSSNGKALPDQYMYDESSYFTLKSTTGNLIGILRKGSHMKHSVKWWKSNDESCIIWRRNGNVTFNFVQVEPKVRRNSSSSVRTVSTSPIQLAPLDTPMLGSDGNLLLNRAELLHQRTPPVLLSDSTSGCFSSLDGLRSNSNSAGLNVAGIISDQQQDEMFEVIKAHCSKNPLLFRRVVDWGARNNPSHRLTEVVSAKLSKGRVWITAHPSGTSEDEIPIDSLDDIKGAYQEVSTGLWMQPDPEACGSGVQHRLFRDEHRRWVIERHGLEGESWQMRVQELEDGQWVDLKNNRARIRVNIVPVNTILDTLGEELLVSKNDIEKSMDFLFTSCNQVKLSKLKGRNLKHHIANLKMKLEKRIALSLGVQVASTAESIVQE